MARKRSHRGVGSNQHQDKPQENPTGEELANMKTLSSGAASGLNGLTQQGDATSPRAPRVANPLRDIKSISGSTTEIADKGNIEDLNRHLTKMRVSYQQSVDDLASVGEKPDRAMRRFNRALNSMETRVLRIQNQTENMIDYHSSDPRQLGYTGYRTERTEMVRFAEKLDRRAKDLDDTHDAKVNGADQQKTGVLTTSGQMQPASGEVQLPSTQEYEDAAAILGRGFPAAAAQVEVDAYRRAGKEPPQDLLEHQRRTSRNPYEDF